MATIEELKKLYEEGKYREIIETEKEIKSTADAEKLLQVAWAYHQLGEYDKSLPIMWDLAEDYPSHHEIGESALRGYAHGILQRDGDIDGADRVTRRIPESLGRDNVRMNMMIVAARKGLTIPVNVVMAIVTNVLEAAPYITVNGHIINNGALVLHEAREQESVKPYLPILPGLIEAAIGIYEATGTAKNHIAGALFRASQIFEAAGPEWLKGAQEMARNSVTLWQELVGSQDSARYQRNLEGAQSQLKKLAQ